MGFISNLRQKYFGKQKKKVQPKRTYLKVSTDEICVPRRMRRQCLKQLPFPSRFKHQIKVV